jgi:hypothetical protein
MAKVSRPILYTAVLGAVGYAAFILTQPDTATKKPAIRVLRAAVRAPGDAGITPEDRSAHFERYRGPRHDAFLPHVVATRALAGAGASKPGAFGQAGRGVWVLTGINAINGTSGALLENSTTEDSVVLKVGDFWNGQHVVSVGADTVVLVNDLGQRTELTFPSPDDPNKKPGTDTAGGDAAAHPDAAATPLPPIAAAPAPPAISPISFTPDNAAPNPTTTYRFNPDGSIQIDQ